MDRWGNWKYPPFSGTIAEGSIWGRGALDIKELGIMHLFALLRCKELAKNNDLPYNFTILAVSGEETGGYIGSKIIGVNCRNLKTLEVNDKNFELILPQLPASVLKVAESGISTREQVLSVQELGAKAVLIGETLVKTGNPVHTIKELLNR